MKKQTTMMSSLYKELVRAAAPFQSLCAAGCRGRFFPRLSTALGSAPLSASHTLGCLSPALHSKRDPEVLTKCPIASRVRVLPTH